MAIKHTYYKNRIPNLGEIKKLNKELLDLVGGMKYKNACKFLMLVKMYNNRNVKYNQLTWDDKPYSFFTHVQAADYIDVSVSSIPNIIKYLEDKDLLKVARKANINPCNHVNFYLTNIPDVLNKKEELQSIISATESVKIEKGIDIYTPNEGEFKGDYTKYDPIDFYKKIGSKGTKIEISDVKNIFDIDKKNPVMSIMEHDDCNVYFCGGVNTKVKGRCKDDDISVKSYFAIDIDIRKDIKTLTGEIISDNQLYGYINEIQKLLDTSDYADYDTVVMSGNGVHIYYMGDHKSFDKNVYKAGVSRIYQDIDGILAPLGLKTDKATSNIASLFRCPLTINYGREIKYGLELGPCFIYDIKETDGITFDSLEYIGNQSISETKELIEERKKVLALVAEERKKNFNGDDIFEVIKEIQVHELFGRHTGHELHKDGKNFVSHKDGKYIGCFYNADKNKIINVGTRHITSGENSYGPFDYVMYEILGLSNCKDSIKETIEWFKNEYGI